MNNITELKELIYTGAKFVCHKIGVLLKCMKKHKTWMGNSTGNAYNKSTTTNKNDKTAEERWNMLGRIEKDNTRSKTNNSTRGNKPEVTGERRKTKNISRQDKTIETK